MRSMATVLASSCPIWTKDCIQTKLESETRPNLITDVSLYCQYVCEIASNNDPTPNDM
jgi:hypothetical protein